MHIRSRQALTLLIDETNPAQIQRLRIQALPIKNRPGLTRGGIYCQVSVIRSRPRLDVIFRHARRERKAMPAPMAHRVAADGFQAGAVGVEGEIAIDRKSLAVE